MSAYPPRPWSVSDRTALSFFTDILDAHGERIITVWGRTPARREAVAELIIKAGNALPYNKPET
jgi:hypothetical protein